MKLREGFELLATAPGGIVRLRELILSLAVTGRLVASEANAKSAGDLLENLRREKVRVTAAGVGRRKKERVGTDRTVQPFSLPDTWEWAAGGDLYSVIRGVTYQKQDASEQARSGYVPLLRANNIQASINLNNLVYVPAKLVSVDQYLQAGDIVVCLASGSKNLVGKAASFGGDEALSFGAFCGAVRLYHKSLQPYLAIVFASPYYREAVSEASAGIGINNLKSTSLLDFLVPVPPLAEQARIVAKVDELMHLCDELEAHGRLEAEQHARLTATLFEALAVSGSSQALAENWSRVAANFDLLLDRPEAVDALEQTIVQLAVRGLLVTQNAKDEPVSDLLQRIRAAKDRRIVQGEIKQDKALPAITDEEKPFALPESWEWVRFGDVVQISSGVTLGRKTPLKDPVSLPYLRVANVQRRHLVLSEVKDVIIDRTEIERFRLLRHDLLITEGGDWDKVGRTCLWRDEIDLCLHQNHIFKARGLVDEWCPEWAELFLNSPDARAYFASSAKQTTNLASINMSELKRCVFPAPPVAEQARIVTRVTELRQLCADLRARLTDRQICQAHFTAALVEQTAAAGPNAGSLELAA